MSRFLTANQHINIRPIIITCVGKNSPFSLEENSVTSRLGVVFTATMVVKYKVNIVQVDVGTIWQAKSSEKHNVISSALDINAALFPACTETTRRHLET